MAFAHGKPYGIEKCWNGEFEIQAISFYFNIHQFPCLILSPIRTDHNPSFLFYLNHSNRVRWIDFGTRDRGDLWTLLSLYWRMSVPEVEKRVLKDFSKINAHEQSIKLSVPATTNGIIHHIHNTSLEVKTRDFRDYDLKYWRSFGISEAWLRFGSIYPISHIFITKGNKTSVLPAEKYAYVFVEIKDEKTFLKVYQPFSKTYKWTNKCDKSVWDLWMKLPPTGDRLIITSSRKDALCLWANTGIPSISMQGEGYTPKEHVIQELKQRFKKIYILYDNDFKAEENHGRKYGNKLADRFGLAQIEIPTIYQSKDPSDLYHNHGEQIFKEVIFGLLDQENNCPF